MPPLGILEELHTACLVEVMVLLYGKVLMKVKLGLIYPQTKDFQEESGELVELQYLQ